MKIASSYTAWNFFIHFLMINLFLMIFMMSFQVARIAEFFFSQGLSWQIFIQLMFSLGLGSLQLCVPLAIFISALLVASKMSQNSEYVAFRACGLSLLSLLKPVLIMSLFLGAIFFYTNDEIIPKARAQARRVVAELKSRSILLELKSGTFFTAIPGLTLFAEKVVSPGIDLWQVFLHHQDQKSPDIHRLIFAQSGTLFLEHRLSPQTSSAQGQGVNYLKLKDVVLVIVNQTLKTQEKVELKTLNYLLPSLDSTFDGSRKASFQSNKKLAELKESAIGLIQTQAIDREQFAEIHLEQHDRYFLPLSIVLLSLLGFLLGLGHFRVTKRTQALTAFLVMLGHYGLFFFLSGLAKKAKIPHWYPQILTTGYLLVLLAYWYLRSRWILATSVVGILRKNRGYFRR